MVENQGYELYSDLTGVIVPSSILLHDQTVRYQHYILLAFYYRAKFRCPDVNINFGGGRVARGRQNCHRHVRASETSPIV